MPANQISEGTDDEIKQLHKELDLEIQEIQGIGPTTVRKLKEAGIVSVMDLAATSADELAVDINTSKESAAAFIMAAQKLLREEHIRTRTINSTGRGRRIAILSWEITIILNHSFLD